MIDLLYKTHELVEFASVLVGDMFHKCVDTKGKEQPRVRKDL